MDDKTKAFILTVCLLVGLAFFGFLFWAFFTFFGMLFAIAAAAAASKNYVVLLLVVIVILLVLR